MRYEPAFTIVAANADIVRSILLDARSVTAWNESIASISGPPDATTDASYDVIVQTGVRGHFHFRCVEPERLEFRWEVPDLRECGRWDLEAMGQTTRVTHIVWRHGALAISLDCARRELPHQRVARLAREVGSLRGRPVGLLA